ncbi:N-acetylmuramic acid 6-phosphate etherase [Austwickia chelonae]|uniref:N-acetylmuramic acid 6-phosphate etherase n=1 Tax=Austwickia chelonae TaxID=100225 RepID=UPI000E2795A6|nr:N-acetylmuramic acid 6-phosphate etherase [Austwickia chelonae]
MSGASRPDLGWRTEGRHPASGCLDTGDTAEVVAAVLAADLQVFDAVQAVSAQVVAAAELMVAAVHAGGVVHYVGAGTSGRMGVLDAVELLPTYRVGPESVRAHLAGGLAAMTRAVEGAEDDEAAGAAVVRGCAPGDVVVGIAASGRTPFVRGAVVAARARGLATVLIAAVPDAALAGLVEVAILPDTGPEVVTGSTRMKAATAQKLVLNALSTATMVRLGKTYEGLMIDLVPTNAKLRARSVRMLVQGSGRSEPECVRALAAAQGEVRPALVALVAGLCPEEAGSAGVRAAVAAYPPDPGRRGDPSGVRAAVARVLSGRS